MTTNIRRDLTLTKQLHIFTLNKNRQHNDNKRLETFQNIYTKNIDITLLLQETPPTPGISTKWEKE